MHVSGLHKHDKALLVLGKKGRGVGGGNAELKAIPEVLAKDAGDLS